jgi:hypothetical protein
VEPSRRTNRIPRFWAVDSSPFSGVGPSPQPCRIVLRQVDDNDFQMVEALVLTPPESMRGRPADPLVIEPGWLTSDLASIPGVVGWFARRHGRHTPAALVHDFLITGTDEVPPAGLSADWVLEPEQADLLFREMLIASGVPPVRSYLMWAAVAARTRWKTRPARKLALLVWAVAAGLGTVVLVAGLVQDERMVVVAALVAPVVAAALWGRQFVAGLIAGYAVWWALIGALPAWTAYKLYQGVEGLVWLVRRQRHARAGVPPAEMPPAPVPFDER